MLQLIHLRDLDRVEEQGLVNLMKFKFKALHLGQVSPRYQYRLNDGWVWSSPVEKDLDVPVHIKSRYASTICTCSSES